MKRFIVEDEDALLRAMCRDCKRRMLEALRKVRGDAKMRPDWQPCDACRPGVEAACRLEVS